MRTRILAAMTLSLFCSSWALAQEEEAEAQEEQESQEAEETQGAEVADTPAQPGQVRTSPTQGGRETAPGEVHTVVKGDTLWDLSQRYLGNPWYWPKVWSYNPEVANPHWIYPGNQVRFFPSGEEVPTQVEVGQGPATPVEGEVEGGDVEAGEMIASDGLGPAPDVQVVGKIGYTPKTTRRVMHEGIVTPRELDEAGIIDSSFSEAVMLSYPDTAYVKFKNPGNAKLGDRYVIFRTQSEVRHPVTGGRVGFLTRFLGTMVVTNLGPKLITAQIVDTWDEIRRGDLVGPFGERLVENVAAVPNAREVKGYVVTAMVPYLSMLGEHHNVFIDKGSEDGVQPGNVFTIVRQNDLGRNVLHPERPDKDLPIEPIAQCLAVDVKQKTTTCLMTRSIREVVPGDRAEMRVEGGSPRASLQ